MGVGLGPKGALPSALRQHEAAPLMALIAHADGGGIVKNKPVRIINSGRCVVFAKIAIPQPSKAGP
jgi:hypothetical protein